MTELEAKFLLEQGARPRRVLRLALQELSWAGILSHPEDDVRFDDTYYDTAERHLHLAGWTVRSRREDGVVRITCKQLVSGHGGMFNRQELEQTLIGLDQPGIPLQALEPGMVRDLLTRLAPADATLLPIFSLHTRRRRFRLTSYAHPRAVVELVLDRTRVGGPAPLTFTEIEAELKQGARTLLTEVTAILAHQPSLIRARVGKYQRGLQAVGCPAPAHIGESVPLKPSSAWVDLGIKHLATQAHWLGHHEPLAYESVHPEGVHQMRVATRRIRAALRAFADVLPAEEGERLSDEFRWLTRRLGLVRDLDVQLANLEAYRRDMDPEGAALLTGYEHHLVETRRRAHRRLRRALESARFGRLQHDLAQFIARADEEKLDREYVAIDEVAGRYVPPQLLKIVRRGRRIRPDSPPERLHRLRIEIKRLRYQLEFLAEPYGKPLRKASKSLRRLQDTLGEHQDAWVAREHLSIYREHHELSAQEDRIFKRLLKFEKKKAKRLHKKFFKRWQQFDWKARELRQLFEDV